MNKSIDESEAVRILTDGGVVALPTETVYGLACVAENNDAVKRVYQIKQRPNDNPLICHFYSVEQILTFVSGLNKIEQVLLEHFSPGPLSFLLPLKSNSPLLPATGGRQTVVARIPSHPLFLSVLRRINKPLAAPSANTSGRYSAVNADMVSQDLGHSIDGILDGGECINGIESTILQVLNDEALILRPGVIGPKEITEVLLSSGLSGKVSYGTSIHTTPGARYKHYAPITPIEEINSIDEKLFQDNEALITLDEYLPASKSKFNLSLGSLTNAAQVAANLYKTMFRLDQLHVNKAYIFLPPLSDQHWNTTIRNRLNKMIYTN